MKYNDLIIAVKKDKNRNSSCDGEIPGNLKIIGTYDYNGEQIIWATNEMGDFITAPASHVEPDGMN